MVSLGKEHVKQAVVDAWDIVVDGLANDRGTLTRDRSKREYKLEHRTKIKSMVEGLRQHTDPEANVLHFVKYIEYYLTHNVNLNSTLDVILSKIGRMRQEESDDPGLLQERVKYLIGYLGWSIDGLRNVLSHAYKNDRDREKDIRKMLEVEFSIAGLESNEVEKYLRKIMKWADSS